ncbi:MAG: hypothetical protein LBK42_10715 [Propionibacteriaceae bacterium]|jgi:hypothetical protein|nr:hypothetical protein [Propionibacteriaceae bacterium]
MGQLDAYRRLNDASLIRLSSPGLVRRAAKLALEAAWADRPTTVAVGGWTVRLAASGLADCRCPCPAGGVCVHLLAAALFARADQGTGEADPAGGAVVVSADSAGAGSTSAGAGSTGPLDGVSPHNVSPDSPAGATAANTPAEGLSPTQRLCLESVRQYLARIVRGGLSHLGAETAERLEDLALEAASAGLPLLSKMTAAAAGQAEAVAARRDDSSEDRLTGALAQVWALTRALEAATGAAWPRLRGIARRQYSTAATMSLVPLGASWWESDSGAWGITLFCWEPEAAVLRRVTSTRSGAVDWSFRRDYDNSAFWGSALSTVLRRPFQLVGPRLSRDGALAPNGARVQPSARGFDSGQLDSISAELLSGTAGQTGFGLFERPLRLLAAAGNGRFDLDQSAQELVWTLPLVGGAAIRLRQPVGRAESRRADTLIDFENSGRKVRYVLAERIMPRWQPVSLFLEGQEFEPVSLDFHHFPDRPPDRLPTGPPLRRRLRSLLERRSAVPLPPPPGPITRTLDDSRDLVVALTATGRCRLSPAEAARCQRLAAVCDDLALAVLARSLRSLDPDPTPEALLRTYFLVDRLNRKLT